MFWTRVVTSVVLAPVALTAVYAGFPYFHILVAAMSAAVVWEFTQIVEKSGLLPKIVIALGATVICVGIASQSPILSLIFVVVVCLGLIATERPGRRLSSASTHAALVCAAIPAVSLVFAERAGGVEMVFWLLAVVWATDIGAYAAGRLIGGPKLAPVISPNKTWSGSIGGVICAVMAATAVSQYFAAGPSLMTTVYAALLSIVSQMGDLAESRFKRQHGVKDSGTWIPGHGGVMDRVDGLWSAAPATALICAANNGGVSTW